MEKRIFQLTVISVFLIAGKIFSLSAQVPDYTRTIRIHTWAELDAYPELKEAQDLSSGQWDYPINRIKQVAPFLIEGMLYGWNFTYTPYDKARGVKEYFEITPIKAITASDGKIHYESPWIQDNKLHCWASYTRDDGQIWTYKKWQSLSTEKIRGIGKSSIKLGFDGITEGAKAALKDAIRAHYRPLEKNKPKEITGKVIIYKEPKIGITEGQYMVELDFFLESTRIVKYAAF
ncbi:MAG: hypothetical protein IJL70_04980 [Treponema sp.]|nr:hypothetical protein [Treponema sp.]